MALLVLVLTAVLAPSLAFANACPEDEADGCCIPCGTRCFGCAGGLRAVPSSGAGSAPSAASGRVDPLRLALPTNPSPRDILHVPRPASSRR